MWKYAILCLTILKEWHHLENTQFSTNQITQNIGFPMKNLNKTCKQGFATFLNLGTGALDFGKNSA